MTTVKTPVMPNSIPEFKISLSMKQKASELFLIQNSKDAAEICRKVFDADSIEWVESFIVIGLNRANKVVGFYKISQGGITGTVADPRVIMQFALLSNCSSLILCHNHPSGNLKPSRQDEELTQKIKNAASYFDVKVLDQNNTERILKNANDLFAQCTGSDDYYKHSFCFVLTSGAKEVAETVTVSTH